MKRNESRNGPVTIRREVPGEFPDKPAPSIKDQAIVYGYFVDKRKTESGREDTCA